MSTHLQRLSLVIRDNITGLARLFPLDEVERGVPMALSALASFGCVPQVAIEIERDALV